MRLRSKLVALTVPVLVACGAATATAPAPATAPATANASATASATASASATATASASPAVDSNDRCVAPYLRGRERGVVACPNATGGWSQLTCRHDCRAEGGVCRHPAYDRNPHPPACRPDQRCMGPDPVAAGPCSPACCDPTLGTLPAEVEDRMVSF